MTYSRIMNRPTWLNNVMYINFMSRVNGIAHKQNMKYRVGIETLDGNILHIEWYMVLNSLVTST